MKSAVRGAHGHVVLQTSRLTSDVTPHGLTRVALISPLQRAFGKLQKPMRIICEEAQE